MSSLTEITLASKVNVKNKSQRPWRVYKIQFSLCAVVKIVFIKPFNFFSITWSCILIQQRKDENLGEHLAFLVLSNIATIIKIFLYVGSKILCLLGWGKSIIWCGVKLINRLIIFGVIN